MDNPYDVIIGLDLTEKTTRLQEQYGRYAFRVHPNANKVEIARAVEQIFKVKVAGVNTLRRKGKRRRVRYAVGLTPGWKRAIVKLQKGHSISVS